MLMRLLLSLKVSVDSSFTAVKSSGNARASETKGQLISKCLFGVFNFSQKANENKST